MAAVWLRRHFYFDAFVAFARRARRARPAYVLLLVERAVAAIRGRGRKCASDVVAAFLAVQSMERVRVCQGAVVAGVMAGRQALESGDEHYKCHDG